MCSIITISRLVVVAAALAIVPQSPLVRDRVDIIELNRVYDDQGRQMLAQVIFWDWRPRDSRFHVVAWRLWKAENVPPTRDWARGDFVLLWHDGDLLREVRATAWRETWTQFDPEMDDRNLFPKGQRRGLSHDSPMSGVKPSTLESPAP